MLSKEEYIKKLKELSEKPGNIEGIYNYCDRWCERCEFTSKCLNYKLHSEAGIAQDMNNANFWQDLHTIFEATFEMLAEGMERFGINIEEIKEEVRNNQDKEPEDPDEKHPLTIQAKDMGFDVMKWLDKFYEENEELMKLGIETGLNEPSIKNAIDIIGWYALFISAKINRAMSIFNEDDDDETMKYDSDGSAKIALIAIDRSIEAWTYLYTKRPSDEETILKYLLELSSIKKQMEKLFPDARAFVRPGFDEIG